MMYLAAALISLAYQATTIHALADIRSEIAYIDRATRYFVAIDGINYVMGEPIYEKSNVDNDVPQAFGKVSDCTTKYLACRSLSQFHFIVPKHKNVKLIQHVGGVKITLTRTSNGWRGSAICQAYEGFGCSTTKADAGPVLTYQYRLNRDGAISEIAIQYWDRARSRVQRHRLMLSTSKSLRLS
jgi:hypothetical protein